MDSIISVVVLLVIVVIAIGIALSIGKPVIDSTIKTSDIKNAEDDIHTIDNYIRTVAREGRDSVRIFKFSSPKDFKSIPGEDAIQFSTQSPVQLVEYLTRTISGDLLYVSGNNVNCQQVDGDGDGTIDLVAENDKIKAVFRKVPSGALRTHLLITRITDKTNNVTAYIGNSSILINDDASTSTGTSGYTEISNGGLNLPLCQIHAFVNSTTLDYDIYYKLYAGADFIVMEVRNIG